MVNKSIMLTVIFWFLITAGCFASATREASTKVPGLTSEDSNLLNGVWEQLNMLESQAKADPKKSVWDFSWGKGRVSPFSLIIDLTAKEPVIQLITAYWVDVLSVTKPEPYRYVFKTRNKYARDPERKNVAVIDTVDIKLHADGTITCINSFEANSIEIDQGQYHFFRTYGPGISQ